MNIKKVPLWTKDFILISTMFFFVGLMFFLTMITISAYAIEEFNAPKNMAGVAASIFVIGVLVARLFTGKFLEVVGRKKLMYIGIGLTFLTTLFYFPVENLSTLIVVRFAHGAVVGIALTSLQTAVMDLIPIERQGEGISYFTLSFIIATAIGPFLGVLISVYGSMNMIFVACTVFSLIPIVLSFFVNIPEAELTPEQLEEIKGFRLKNFLEPNALPIALLMGIVAICYSSIISFLTTYSTEINLMSAASFFFIVYAICILISRPFTGRILDIRGDNLVMYPAYLLFAIGLLVLSQAEHGFTLLLAAALIGFGYGNLQSASQTIATKKAPHYRVGLATSTYFICMEGGMGLGPFLLGYLIPVIGFRNMYLTLAIIVLSCSLAYYIIHGKRKGFENKMAHYDANQ